MIRNKYNRKIYIGQTIVKYPSARWGEHVFDAKHNKGYYLHRSMRKYGIENFEFKIIIRNIPETQLDFYEKLWIQKLDTTNPMKGYNLAAGGSVLRGSDNPMYGHTPWNKGIPRTEIEKQHMRDGQAHLKEQKSLRVSGKNNPMYGHMYTAEELHKLSVSHSGENNGFYGKHHSNQTKEILKQKNQYKSKPIDMIDLNTGEILKQFHSTREAARYINESQGKTNTDKSFISRCASGNHKYAYGFGWRFSERCND